jgi:hypothetical protein
LPNSAGKRFRKKRRREKKYKNNEKMAKKT